MAINNYITFPDRRPAFKDKGQIDEILSKYSNFPYVHTANICGARIKLLTNSKHVSEFWQLNWYASDSKDADGFVYIITGVEGYEPCLFYNLEKRIALGVNTEYYGLAKSKSALGLATEILKEMEKYPMHAASVSLKRNNEEFGVADEKGNVKEVFKGKENVTDKINLKYVLLLTRDEETPIIKKIECDEAIRILKEGNFKIMPGGGPPEKWGQYGKEPFYDPYQLEMDLERQEKFFRKLFDYGVIFYLLNTGSYEGRKIEVHQTHAYIRAALRIN